MWSCSRWGWGQATHGPAPPSVWVWPGCSSSGASTAGTRLTSSWSCYRLCTWFLRTVASGTQTPYTTTQSSRSACPRDSGSNALTRVTGPQKRSTEGSTAPVSRRCPQCPARLSPASSQTPALTPHLPDGKGSGVCGHLLNQQALLLSDDDVYSLFYVPFTSCSMSTSPFSKCCSGPPSPRAASAHSRPRLQARKHQVRSRLLIRGSAT